MREELLRQTIRSLRERAEPAPVGVADMQLLARFVAARDEAAFELLLRRYGPMVLGVCRRLLRQTQDAEDAFQATFLILAHKAGSIRHGVALGGWLYRVAYRVALRALRARADRVRQGGRQEAGVDTLAAPAHGAPDNDDLRRVLDEEINRLPARLRDVFVLCCLDGKTGAEAAAELRCPPGTVSSRLTRARARLRFRLQRRGIAPVGAALASAALADQALAASLPASLLMASLRSVALARAGAAACTPDRILAEGVLRTMFLSKLSMAGLLLAAACLIATCGFFAMHVLAAPPEQAEAQVQPAPLPEAGPQDKTPRAIVVSAAKPRPGPGLLTAQPMTVRAAGRVDLNPDIAGVLKSLSVGLGDSVQRGQVLAEMDAPALVLAAKQAAVAVEQAKSQIEEVKARVDTAQAEVDVAKSTVQQRQAEVRGTEASVAISQNHLTWTRDLAARKVVGASEVREKEDALMLAKARVAAAQAAVANAHSDVRVKQGKVAQTRAALRSAEAGLASAELAAEQATQQRQATRVRAPFDGVVTAVNYTVGHAFRPGERGPAGPLLTLERTDRLHAVVLVPQDVVPWVAVGSPVVLHLDGLPDVKTSDHAITRTAFALDPQSRTMRVEIDMANPGQRVHPGMFGRAEIFRTGGILLVPRKAVVSRKRADGTMSAGVYVVRKNQAHFTPVQHMLDRNGPDIEILADLSPDALVVTDPTQLQAETVSVELKTAPKSK
jgi:HlyD family secretion protein